MKVFATGATGFVGSAVVQNLLAAGHEVTGLARSERGAEALISAGARAHHGDIEDPESLKQGAKGSDGVIHTAFIHDFARFNEASVIDRRAIEALGSELVGSGRPLVVASGTAIISPGQMATEDDASSIPATIAPRVASEEVVQSLAERGVRASIVRLSPSVHGDGDHGFIPTLIGIAHQKGVSAYVGEGQNRWSAVHRFDAAELFRLALERGTAGSRYHGVAEEEIPFREIAEAIGRGLNLPVIGKSDKAAEDHFGWFARFAGLDCPASGKFTQERLGWRPTHRSLLSDLRDGSYFNYALLTTRGSL